MSQVSIPPKITLRAARVNAGFSQADAAKALNIDRLTLMWYESGKRVPNFNRAMQMCELYNYPADFIFFGKASTESGQEEDDPE